MVTDQTDGKDDIAELRERIRLLEARVAYIEQGQGIQPAPARETRSAAETDSGLTAATVFTRVAMLSFVLMGALILRVLTERHALGAVFGTLLGVVYAGHLVVLSFLPGRLGRLARETSLFQCSGVVLGFSIALESSMRLHTFDRPMAMALIAGFSALGLSVGVVHRKPSLAATAAMGSIMALVLLGLEAEGLRLQLTLLTALGATAAGLSWRRGWGFLRLLAFPPLLCLLAAGLWLARRESLAAGPLLTSAVIFWAIVLLQHVLAFRRLTWTATWWLPTVTAWLAGMAWQENCWDRLAYGATAASVLAVGGVALATRRIPTATAGAAGAALTAAAAGVIGWLSLDASGVLCALLGIGLWLAAGKDRPSWGAGFAVLSMAAAAIRGLIGVVGPTASKTSLIAATFLSAALFLHYLYVGRAAGRAATQLHNWLASVVLLSGLLVLFGVLRTCARGLFQDPGAFQLSQTALLTATAIVLTFLGHTCRRRHVEIIGWGCMVILVVKVAANDLARLNGIHLISSVLLLGLSSVIVSWIVRRRL